ncbi:ABC transporter permease [Pseudonocardia nematodicida]|uniref:ABC transporter permease n=1 Tax=Pseudonocardia nematodicida TaxID=1206997 RepID=A0ABV1KIK9_9PSEU
MTTGTARPPASAWRALVAAEARMVARDTAGLVVPLGLPLLILVMVGTTAPPLPPGALDGRTPLEVFGLPVAAATVLGLVGFTNVPSFLAHYRRSGVLRRLGVTPAGPAPVLAAQVAVGFAQVAVGIGLAFGVAVVAFGAGAPAAVWTALGGLLLGAAAFFAVGLLVAALAPTTNAAIAAGLVLFLGTGALGGMFGDPTALPGPLAEVGQVLPFGATVHVLSAAWLGATPELAPVLGLVVTTVLASVAAARWFRWE